MDIMDQQQRLCVLGGLPWKHGFARHARLPSHNQDEILHVLVTRHPYEWLDSMRRNGFYAALHKGLPMADFLTLEWMSLNLKPSHLSRMEAYLAQTPPNKARRSFAASVSPSRPQARGESFVARPGQTGASRKAGARRLQTANESWEMMNCLMPRLPVEDGGGLTNAHRGCFLGGKHYICVPDPFYMFAGRSPALQDCVSNPVGTKWCGKAALLCVRHHPFLFGLHPEVWHRANDAGTLIYGGGPNLFQKLMGSGPALQDLMEMEIKISQGTTSALCQGLNQCNAEPSRWTDDACCYSDRTYRCDLVPSYQVLNGEELPPSRFCLGGNESLALCNQGRFLCLSAFELRQPWRVYPDLWAYFAHVLAVPGIATKRSYLSTMSTLPKQAMIGTDNIFASMKPDRPKAPWGQLEEGGEILKYFASATILELLRDVEFDEMLSDRDPDSGGRFPTLMAMREAKLRDWLHAESSTLANTHHATCRDFMLDPRDFLNSLEKTFGLSKNPRVAASRDWDLEQFGNDIKGSKESPKTKDQTKYYLEGYYMDAFVNKDLSVANAWLDPELEAAFGYRLFDTVVDAAVPYTLQSRCSYHRTCPV